MLAEASTTFFRSNSDRKEHEVLHKLNYFFTAYKKLKSVFFKVKYSIKGVDMRPLICYFIKSHSIPFKLSEINTDSLK